MRSSSSLETHSKPESLQISWSKPKKRMRRQISSNNNMKERTWGGSYIPTKRQARRLRSWINGSYPKGHRIHIRFKALFSVIMLCFIRSINLVGYELPPIRGSRKSKSFNSSCGLLHKVGNGLTEVTNKEIVKGIEKRLGRTLKGWVDELPQVLWTHKTSQKRSNGESPFSLTYEMEAVLPIEIRLPTKTTKKVNLVQNEKDLRINLEVLEERREIAAIMEAAYKKKLEK
uniref:Reverse transcriptase domain-containing protein n=1 Tax=Tanacetum cinerariifolium TaxID=118510 RepID=A0A699JKD1_TANCI|nr:hypothetical protein [Tanacetum cinerariifolium]